MIQNKIYHVKTEEMEMIIQDAQKSKNSCLVELHGNEIQSWGDYIVRIEESFKFPSKCYDIIDRYLDWIRDLMWLRKNSYVIVIHNYREFLKQEPSLKKMIIDDFLNVILPWWQEEVVNCVVEGKPKSFNVYLVD